MIPRRRRDKPRHVRLGLQQLIEIHDPAATLKRPKRRVVFVLDPDVAPERLA